VKQVDLREGARRQHRAIAIFAVIQCWLRNLDGIVLKRGHLERLLGLDRFKGARVDWLNEDFQEFFPYLEVLQRDGAPNSFGSLYVSRRKLAEKFPSGTMSDEERVAKLQDAGLQFGLFEIWDKSEARKALAAFQATPSYVNDMNCDESFMATYLALLAGGLISPRSLPLPLKREIRRRSAKGVAR
jgi:hypothetical protein